MSIIIGKYYPERSFIHLLNARTKLLALFIYIISVFIAEGLISYAFLSLLTFYCVKKSKIPLKLILKALKPIFFISVFTFIFNVFFTENGNVLFKYAFIVVTDYGILFAVKVVMRLILFVVGSSILIHTTKPIELTDAIEWFLTPLKPLRFPVHETAMMMTISLRFIPIIADELDKIKKAQIARGSSFEDGNIIMRAKSLIPLLVPLFISVFRRADELAIAMEARCYRGGKGRTKMKKIKFIRNDYYVLFFMPVFLLIVIIFNGF